MELMDSEETTVANDSSSSSSCSGSDFSRRSLQCHACCATLVLPYVKCSSCQLNAVVLCLQCFSRGEEFGLHESNHDYEIMGQDFNLWNCSWKASEELKLTLAIKDAGLGNWHDVAREMGKSAAECENHYMLYYINAPQPPLPRLVKQCKEVHSIAVPSRVGDDPPRPAFDSLHLDMAGYSAARGDFIAEYNNYAEMDLKDVEFFSDDETVDDLAQCLNLAMVDIYCNHLCERARRKKIIRDYGLINVQKESVFWQRYDFPAATGNRNFFKALMHLVPAEEFNAFLESLQYQSELQQKIIVLQELREAGLTTFSNAEVYQKLKFRRVEELHALSTNESSLYDLLLHLESYSGSSQPEPCCASNDRCACSNNEQRMEVTSALLNDYVVARSSRLGMTNRRAAPPLDISGLPGYEKLTAKEQQLCSVVRFVPDAYLEFKSILLSESQRNGGTLKLAQARQLIKIDVNKTRKLYDFLIQEGLLHCPA